MPGDLQDYYGYHNLDNYLDHHFCCDYHLQDHRPVHYLYHRTGIPNYPNNQAHHVDHLLNH